MVVKNEKLLEYLEYAKENKYALKIIGISGKYSNVFVDYYTEDKMVGQFCGNLAAMSFKFENIVSCCFVEEEVQHNFLKKQQGRKLYGENAEEIEAFLKDYKCYYQQIIQEKKESDTSGETNEFLKGDKNSLKAKYLERFDKIFERTYFHPESLLFQYFFGYLSEEGEKIEKQPILLFSRSNFSQKQAIENALEQKVSVIEGPPGTGKTTTILSIVLNLVVKAKKVVVVSKNNSAVDNIKEELDKFQLPPFYLRLGQRKEIIEKQVNPNLKDFVQECMNYGSLNGQVYTDSEDLQKLYLKLKFMEADINQLMIKKNRLQEAENMLRHMEKRREAFQIEKEFIGRIKFQKRSTDSMRREIDRIARALQQLDYKGRYSVWNRLKNSFIWKMDKKEFASEGLLLQFQLEYLYLMQEIMELSKELEDAELDKKQSELKMMYDTQYIGLSLQVLEQFLHHLFSTEKYRCLANQIICCEEQDIYREYKKSICELYPVILTTADALVYNFSDYIDSDQKIDYIIMDEASQCDLLTGIPVLHLAKRCVIVGDQKQLSAITGEEIFELSGVKEEYCYFSENLLSSVRKVWKPATVLLREHYRCDYSIINYCNKFFYNNELIIYTEANPNAMGILRVEQGKYVQPSLCNEREAVSIEGVMGKELKDTYIITPFRRQGELLREHFQCGKDVCGTIHTFQGRGKENVFFSTVLNDFEFADRHLAGEHCLFDNELLNVAVSRAKKQFVLVSDVTYFRKKNSQMRDLVDYIENYGKEIPDTTVCLFDGLYAKMKAYTSYADLENIFEKILYQYIEKYCEKHIGLYCRMKLPLADLVTDKVYLEQNPEICKFILYHNTHVDFTLCNAVDKPILAIELDGRWHESEKQRARDRKKDSALEHMKIPVWRISSKTAMTQEEFESKVTAFFENI